MQLRSLVTITAAVGLGAVAPSGATAADACSDGAVSPGTVVKSISSLGSSTGLQGPLAPLVAPTLAEAAGHAARLDGQVKLESVCPNGL